MFEYGLTTVSTMSCYKNSQTLTKPSSGLIAPFKFDSDLTKAYDGK